MKYITFSGVPNNIKDKMIDVFMIIKAGKEIGKIDGRKMELQCNESIIAKFWHPSEQEKSKFCDLWTSTKPELRDSIKELQVPWDYESWIEALNSAEIDLVDISVDCNGNGEISLKQLSWPSGGIESMEWFVKIFDGIIIENTMN